MAPLVSFERITKQFGEFTAVDGLSLDDGLVLKAAVMNESLHAARAVHVGDRVWLSWVPDAGVLLTE